MDMNKSIEQWGLDLCAVRRLTRRKCVPSEHLCLRVLSLRAAFTTVLASSSLRKNAELNQGLGTLQSGKKTAPVSPSLHQYYFGGANLNKESPQYKNRGKQKWAWKLSWAGWCLCSGTQLTAFSPTDACVWLFDPLEASQQFSIWVLRWLSAPSLIAPGSPSSGGAYGIEPFSGAIYSDSDMSCRQKDREKDPSQRWKRWFKPSLPSRGQKP